MQKEYKTRHDWVGNVIHWELCKKFKFDHTNEQYMHNPESILENEMHQVLWDFEIQMDHLTLVRWLDLVIVNKKKIADWIVDFAFLADHRVKLKESEKRDKYPDLVRGLKKLWNLKVMVILIVIGVLSTVTKGLVQGMVDLEIRAREETTQTTALLRLARILRRDLKTWEVLLSLKLQWETIC